MAQAPHFLMTDPGHYDVCYRINPWMRPDAWRDQGGEGLARARAASAALAQALCAAGARVETTPGRPGLPDMVFPANAAVVLDGKALLARFATPERRGEEAPFRAAFRHLQRCGVIDEIVELPPGVVHEGAGDAHWDAGRRVFWTGYGQRSDAAAGRVVREVFGQEVVALELATPRFYHLDTCFCPLSGGEVLYYPPAFTPAALRLIRDRVPADLRLEATDQDAAAFCVNAVNLDETVIMARAPDALRARLAERGYRVVEVDLAPFILSGGGAYCMTLRLDRRSSTAARIAA